MDTWTMSWKEIINVLKSFITDQAHHKQNRYLKQNFKIKQIKF